MHTAVLGPTNAAVHDRGVLGEAPALFVAGGLLFCSRRVQGAHDARHATCHLFEARVLRRLTLLTRAGEMIQ